MQRSNRAACFHRCRPRFYLRLLLAFLPLGLSLMHSVGFASEEPGHFRLGFLAGQVGLFGDPGSGGANSVGYGLEVGYRLDERLALTMHYVSSSHTRVDHRDLSVGADYFLGDYETASPHLSFGMSFIGNSFKDVAAAGDAAGIYIGGGLDFEVTPSLTIGPQVFYQKAFESTTKVGATDLKTVQDSYMVLLRVLFQLGITDPL